MKKITVSLKENNITLLAQDLYIASVAELDIEFVQQKLLECCNNLITKFVTLETEKLLLKGVENAIQ